MRDHQLAVVEDVARHQPLDKRLHLLDERRLLPLELRQRFGEPMGDLHVLAVQLAQELHLVVAGNAQRALGLDHLHHHAQHAGNVGPAIDEIAEEHCLAPAGVTPRRAVVTEPVEERGQLFATAVNVADDVELAVLVLLSEPCASTVPPLERSNQD